MQIFKLRQRFLKCQSRENQLKITYNPMQPINFVWLLFWLNKIFKSTIPHIKWLPFTPFIILHMHRINANATNNNNYLFQSITFASTASNSMAPRFRPAHPDIRYCQLTAISSEPQEWKHVFCSLKSSGRPDLSKYDFRSKQREYLIRAVVQSVT